MIEELPQAVASWGLAGIEDMNRFVIHISKTHFGEASQFNKDGILSYDRCLPKQGDIIQLTTNGVFYDVLEVNDKIEMAIERSHVWEISLRVMVESKYTLLDEMINDEIKDHINIEDALGAQHYC